MVFRANDTNQDDTAEKGLQNKRARRKRNEQTNILLNVFEWLESILFALVFVMVLFTFVFKTYTVDGESMMPTLRTGDYVFAYSLMYTPQPGDVVIIDASNNYGRPLIKRVIAVGGQLVDVDSNGSITVDGQPYPYFEGTNPANLSGDVSYPLVVPEGYVFVMGDNRANSLDSRYSRVGFIDERSIVGKEIYALAN